MSLKSSSGHSGGAEGYLKVQRHSRNAVTSFGFALVTVAAFSAALAVPPIAQAQLVGYKYPAKHVRHTQPQDGWLSTAATPAFDPAVTVVPVGQSQLTGYRYPARTVRQTEFQDGWLETATHDWAVDRTPYSLDQRMRDRAALIFRYSVASSGFSTDGSSPPAVDAWTEAKFQNISGDRTPVSLSLRYRYAEYPNLDWLYPALWTAEKFQNGSGARTLVRTGLCYRCDGYPATDWIYANLPAADIWDESKFQNNSGDSTPIRAALKFRYPLASSGFSTDGSSPPAGDTWSEAKFQSIHADRMRDRREYDPRYEYHKFPFGLVDARAVMPAIDQLANSERAAQRKGKAIVTPDSLGWLYENLPVVFDPQYLIHSDDSRMRERYKKVPPLDQFAQDWIYTSIPPFDPQYIIHVLAPTRMADRDKLDTRLASFYNDMAWLRDVLALPDPVIAHNLLIDVETGEIWMRLSSTSQFITKVT